MAESGDGGFSFPALPKPKPLPARVRARSGRCLPREQARFAGRAADAPLPAPTPPQNPLLSGATVTDRTAAGGGAAQPPALVAVPAAALPPPPRRKVPFEKGFSQMDWVRLTQTHPDLAGLGPGGRPRRGITMEEVAMHASEGDCWTVLRGKARAVCAAAGCWVLAARLVGVRAPGGGRAGSALMGSQRVAVAPRAGARRAAPPGATPAAPPGLPPLPRRPSPQPH